MSNILRIRGIARAVKLEAEAAGLTLTQMLERIIRELHSNRIKDGQLVISTAEGGGSVSFAVPAGMSPVELLDTYEEVMEWCQGQDDPDNPLLNAPRIKRFRASFRKATV